MLFRSGSGKRTYDYGTVAYDAASGTELWRARWGNPGPGPSAGFNGASCLAVDPTGARIFVSGQSANATVARDSDVGTLAYNAATGAQLPDPALGETVGGDLRAEVAAAFVRIAHVGEDDAEQLVVETDRRDDQPLLEELARLRRKTRGLHAADVRVVRAGDGVAE